MCVGGAPCCLFPALYCLYQFYWGMETVALHNEKSKFINTNIYIVSKKRGKYIGKYERHKFMYLYLHIIINCTVNDWRRIGSANDKMASSSLLYCITGQQTLLCLKGHGNEPVFSIFLHKLVRPRFLKLPIELFRFWLRICGNIQNRKTTSRICDRGESTRLPWVFLFFNFNQSILSFICQ
jgi:hypothetical protein